ncbi:40S ribosomal protein S5-1 [Hordeum vulgare]|nr:40S ribosomal protein S5-1 [Hordeum vulgare]
MEVLKHPQSIKMSEGMLHIRDVEGPKKTGSMETRLEAMEQQVFKCQGMVERGLNANHTMITEFTSNHKMDAIDIGKHLSRLYDRVDQLQGQIYDLQNQNLNAGGYDGFRLHLSGDEDTPAASTPTDREVLPLLVAAFSLLFAAATPIRDVADTCSSQV